MFVKNPQLDKIIIGKLIGLIFGVFALIFISKLVPSVPKSFTWGMLLWYLTFGAIIGSSLVVMDIVERSYNIKVPWYITTTVWGAWLGAVIAMLTQTKLQTIIVVMTNNNLHSPFWMVADNAIAGFVIGFFTNLFGVKSDNVEE